MTDGLGKVPVVRLGELLSEPVRNGYSPLCGDKPTGRWVLALSALGEFGLDATQVKPAPLEDPAVQRTQLRPGDFLVSRSNTRDKVGRACMWRGEVPHCSYPDLMMRFRIREDLLHPEYLESYLHSHVTRRHLERHASGTSGSMVKIAKRTVETLAIPLPPLADQRRIAAGLATWDLGIEVVRKLVLAHQQLLGGTRARLLAEAAGNSSVWTQHLGGIATVKKGEQLNKTAMTDRGQYYVLNGGVAPSGRTDRANVAANTVTVSEGGNSCGFVQFNVEDFWCGGHCYALLEVDRSVEVRYLYHYLKARQLRLMGLRTGSGLPNIQKRDLEAVVVAVPPVQEQRRIVDCLDAIERKRALIAEIGRRYGQQKAILSRALLDPSNGGQR